MPLEQKFRVYKKIFLVELIENSIDFALYRIKGAVQNPETQNPEIQNPDKFKIPTGSKSRNYILLYTVLIQLTNTGKFFCGVTL